MNISYTHIFISMITTFIAISVLRPFAISINLTDSPNNRKKHEGIVPLIGGLGMFFGFLITVLTTSIDLNHIKYFLLASFIVVIIGTLDDHRDISVGYRFFFQIAAAVIVAVVAGVNIESLGNLFLSRGEILLNSWSVFFTIIAIIVAMNAVNMSDGIHGLAGLTCFITLLSLAYFSYISVNQESLTIALLICAVIPPFLFYNLGIGRSKEKRIFMGDAGSMFLGLGIVWLLVDLSQGEYRSFSPVIALWLFAIPLIDSVSTVLRRLIIGKSPFKPDLNHLHHILIRLGLSTKFVLIIIVLFSLFMTFIGIMGELNEISEWKMFIGFIVIFVIYFILTNLFISKNNINNL
ncbi:undecaprenyl-phosphate alpha-N-acetylglucosaminyl 1-phosphate transferase [Candidatus Thioglobus sp.]|nr:undecaprenyl-phosphate alpha-N-acetylglucosaminyl 1-phosphate transferase [Candidatus Thioglobus sp.]